MNNDLISRSALKAYIKENGYVDANALDTFPSAEVGKWISVKDRLPSPETEVIIRAARKYNGKTYNIITTSMYEDGTISTEDSVWVWYDLDFDYDEENDKYYIPEGWWEYRHYNPDGVYNCVVEDEVTHWMPLPKPPEEDEKCFTP